MELSSIRPKKIVSGGQTGVDRAALDVARSSGIPHGGWCPRGRIAEDGPISSDYLLTETLSADYAVRTRKNVADSDGTLIVYLSPLEGGTALTYRKAVELSKTVFLLDLDSPPHPKAVEKWLAENKIETLNVAGPRESQRPGIYEKTVQLLRSYWATSNRNNSTS